MLTSEYELTTDGVATEPPSLGTRPMAVAGPRLPRREVWIDMPEEYPGFKVRVWLNYPRRLNDELRSGDPERVAAVLRLIILAHNDWSDSDGMPLPPATSDAFWDEVPDELAASVIVLLLGQVGKLAGSLATRKTR